ncbi:MAG: hypothetical protein EHM33_12460 [Chloroflexi bacterium]|nr:MAG: hypothetical protein EHM33_12460 [Chloroflexota bacterium]
MTWRLTCLAYPFPGSRVSGPPSIDELRKDAQTWDKIIIHVRELIHQYAGHHLPIAITEFNPAYDQSVGGEATPDSHYNAIWMADALGRMIENGVFMANEWALTARGGYGSLGLIGQTDVYPMDYTCQMYKKFGSELVYSSSDNPDLSIYAAQRADETPTIMVINLSLEEKTKALRIGDRPRFRQKRGFLIPCKQWKTLESGIVQSNYSSPTVCDVIYCSTTIFVM